MTGFPVMPAILALVCLAILWSLYRFHLDKKNSFNLIDLLSENGKASKISFMVMGSFTLHSWVMLDLELHSKMTEGYLTIYGATWVTPLLARIFLDIKGGDTNAKGAKK